MPAPDFVQGGHGPIVSMGDFVFEQDACGLPTGGTGSRNGRGHVLFFRATSAGIDVDRILHRHMDFDRHL